MRAIRFFCLLCLLIYAGTGSAWAAGESNARSMGMGGAYTGVARNLDALDWNPANRGLSGGGRGAGGFRGGGLGSGK
ncbi:MAG: hypothetical protein J7M27_03460, partial [Candidatus Latescibacteria bacterium]|nr:hypothetical protein [Candidatus Latescibacterota bacterium]